MDRRVYQDVLNALNAAEVERLGRYNEAQLSHSKAIAPFNAPNPTLEQWAWDHGVELTSAIFRIEMLIDYRIWKGRYQKVTVNDSVVTMPVDDEGEAYPLPTVVFHRYKLDAQGKKYLDPATNDVAVDAPIKVPLRSLPPVNWNHG